uniref:Zinc finger MYM-type protein 1-like n=1 Tax=Nicotiana sylvestris TaxID=4096 RepID=A0A1U7YEK1_NICSY|nr:PREDICTED: zinc finger MYM-type protein 1-like [Nicotiana sylvestris]
MALASQSQNSVKRYFTKAPKPNLASHTQPIQLENINHLEVPSSNEFDLDSLKFDPGERTQILDFHPNHRDIIRREYLRQCPCQPRLHNFPKTNFSGSMRRFNPKWFDDEYHDWLEYSVSKDASYCLYCYLFKDNNIHQGGGDVFSSIGFKSWHKKKSFDKHGSSSIHNESKKKCQDLRQQWSIQSSFERQSNQLKHEYWIRLTASVNVVRLLITQGLAFRGHDESKSSLSRGNFLQTLSWYAKVCDNIRDYVLEHAPQNDQMTSPIIQKDIVTACKIETTKAIIEELNGDYFALLVDESFDTSRKEQMAIVLRYVDRMGFVMERLIDVVHVQNTCASSLKSAIVNLLDQHSLSLSYVRGQCYDGASNMQGEINGLKMSIKRESRSAHSIHCFAHQLQLTLVAVSKKCLQVGELVVLVSNILNILGSSFKRMDEFRESQKERIQEALDMGEFTTGRGLESRIWSFKSM